MTPVLNVLKSAVKRRLLTADEIGTITDILDDLEMTIAMDRSIEQDGEFVPDSRDEHYARVIADFSDKLTTLRELAMTVAKKHEKTKGNELIFMRIIS